MLPMSDQPIRTMVNTIDQGELAFQEYFVHQNCQPRVNGFRFAGIESALPANGVLEAINQADAIVICPSNPWVSIDPILALKGLRSALTSKLVVAVSPIIGGRTIKGPAAKMYAELGFTPTALAVVNHYADFLSGFILDILDANLAQELSIPFLTPNTIMITHDDRWYLAQEVLNFIRKFPPERQ